MASPTSFAACGLRSPAAPPAWGWPWSGRSFGAAPTWPSWARGRDRVERVAREQVGAHGIVGDVAAKDDIYPMAMQILGELWRRRRPHQQRVGSWTCAAGLAR